MAYPIKTDRGEKDTAKAHKMMGYKQGGAVKDAGTNIHISINAAKPPGAPGGDMPNPALASALAQAAQPPMPPPAPMGGPPDMGGGMGGPPLGPGAGPGPIAMRRGGKVTNKPSGGETSAATKTRGDKIYPVHKTDTKPARKSSGGGVAQLTNASGGAGGGGGRLKKAHDEARS